MRVLLTGATGFIGAELLEQLLARGESVRVLVRPETLARSEAARRLGQRAGVEVATGTLTDAKALAEAARDIEVVFHLAWQWKSSKSKSPSSQNDSPSQVEVNVKGAEYLLAACVANRVRRLVFTSSVAVYGPPGMVYRLPVTEETPLMQRDYERSDFTRYYMAHKIAVENLIRSYARQFDLEYVILRPSVVYGARAPFAARLVKRILTEPRWVPPEGTPAKLQMIHVEDVARALVLAGTESAVRNRELNIAGSDIASEGEIKTLIWAAAAPDDVNHLSTPGSGDVRPQNFQEYEFPRYDISRARTLLKYSPQVPLRLGVEQMVKVVLQDSASTYATTLSSPKPAVATSTQVWNEEAAGSINIREFYDERIESDFLGKYFERSGFWNFGYRVLGTESPRTACENLVRRLLDLIPDKTGRILDIGCGNGATTRLVAEYYPPGYVTGLNFSGKQIERARQTAPGCHFCVMDATALGLPDKSFENLICVEAAHHFQTREGFLREAQRILKPGGRLVLSDALLPRSAPTQPVENYIAGAKEYQELCHRAGFAEVIVQEATNECWGAFAADLNYYARKSLQAGEIDLRRFYEITFWLRHFGPERYLLACCVKS